LATLGVQVRLPAMQMVVPVEQRVPVPVFWQSATLPVEQHG
jgi:hypothetical protein